MFDRLKLTPLEWLMLEYVGQGSPPTFFIDLPFKGLCDTQALRIALDRALRRHPLLCANIRGTILRTLHWVPAAAPAPYLDCADRDVVCTFPESENIDLRRHTGLRVWVRTGDDSTVMRLQFHHACCDGLGALRMIEDLLCAYDIEVHGRNSSARFRPSEPGHVRTRAKVRELDSATRASSATRALAMLKGACKFFTVSSAPLRVPDWTGPRSRNHLTLPTQVSHTFSREQTRDLRMLGVKVGGSSYSVLIRDLMRAIGKWNDEPGAQDGSPIRIIAPISLRTPADSTLSAMNRVSIVLISRDVECLNDPDLLLDTIVSEMSRVVHLGREQTMHRLAALGVAFPLLRWIWNRHSSRRCCATSILSSVCKVMTGVRLPRQRGKICCGGLVLQRIIGAPPVSPFTPAVFGCGWYAGQLTLSMNYDQSLFDPIAAQRLLGEYVRMVQSSTAAMHRPSTPFVTNGNGRTGPRDDFRGGRVRQIQSSESRLQPSAPRQ